MWRRWRCWRQSGLATGTEWWKTRSCSLSAWHGVFISRCVPIPHFSRGRCSTFPGHATHCWGEALMFIFFSGKESKNNKRKRSDRNMLLLYMGQKELPKVNFSNTSFSFPGVRLPDSPNIITLTWKKRIITDNDKEASSDAALVH